MKTSIEYEKMFVGVPISFNDMFFIYTPKISEIIAIGNSKYTLRVNLLTLTDDDIKNEFINSGIDVNNIDDSVFNHFNYLIEKSRIDKNFLLELKAAFDTFIREPITILFEEKEIVIGDIASKNILNEQNFIYFQNIIRAINGIDLEEIVPEDEDPRAKKFRIKRKMLKDAKKKQAMREGKNVPFHIQMSALCNFDIGIDPINIGNLTIFAFNTLLSTAQEKERYNWEMTINMNMFSKTKKNPEYWIKDPKE